MGLRKGRHRNWRALASAGEMGRGVLGRKACLGKRKTPGNTAAGWRKLIIKSTATWISPSSMCQRQASGLGNGFTYRKCSIKKAFWMAGKRKGWKRQGLIFCHRQSLLLKGAAGHWKSIPGLYVLGR